MPGRLDDRIALVTGGARGLGAGIAQKLAAAGAVVIVADLNDGEDVVSGLPVESTSGRRGQAVKLDVTDTAEVERVINDVAATYGSLDVLVNNAGVSPPVRDLVDTDDDAIDLVMAVNVRGVIATSRAAARVMRQQGHGRIINTASQAGKRAWPGWGAYSASKAAVIAVTQAMALELAPHVLVNAICPGTMLTDMTRNGFRDGAAPGEDWEQNLAQHASTIPVGRLGLPDDIGNMVVFLASDEASFVTGASLNLTGGEQVFF